MRAAGDIFFSPLDGAEYQRGRAEYTCREGVYYFLFTGARRGSSRTNKTTFRTRKIMIERERERERFEL